MSTAEEEADESALWLEMLTESGLVRPVLTARLLDEADQLTRIIVASIKTKRERMEAERDRILKSPINPQSEIRNPKWLRHDSRSPTRHSTASAK